MRHLKQASQPLGDTLDSTRRTFEDLERFFNAWAYNPSGPEEGNLFWTAWLNHNGNNIATLQDAQGPMVRGIVLQSCSRRCAPRSSRLRARSSGRSSGSRTRRRATSSAR